MKDQNKDKKFGLRLAELRNDVRLYQREAAPKVGIKIRALQGHESGKMPSRRTLAKYVKFYGCSKGWLLTGIEPKYQNPDLPKDVSKGALYNKVKMRDIHTAAPGGEYNAGMDDFGKAASGLKEIFDSGDPVLIPAIQANIHAFQISVRREAHIQEQIKEIDNLKKRMEALEKHIKEGDRRRGERRLEDLGPPDGVERRSGLERRLFESVG